MRIGIDARFLGYSNSGLAHYSESLLEALARRDNQNEYCVFVNARLNRRLKLDDNFRLIPVRGRPLSLRALRRASRAINQENLDLLHVHYPVVPPLIDCPALLTVHDTLPFAHGGSEIFGRHAGPWRLLWTWGFYPMALRQARWVACVSNATRSALSMIHPEVFHKSFVITSGVDDVFRMPIQPAAIQLIRSRLNLPASYILYSGSARQDKNLAALIRCFAMVRSQNPELKDLHLVLEISGEEHGLISVQRLIQQFDLKRHVRVLTDMGDEERRVICQDARLLCLMARTEGFGFPLLEAQTCRVPVVAADSGALPEIGGPESAVYVNPDNIAECAAMVERVLTDKALRSYLIEHGEENARRYDWTACADHFRQVYELLFYPRDQVTFPSEGWLPALLK